MNKYYKNLLFLFSLLLIILPNRISFAEISGNSLSGKILLQVESRGEAWYVNPINYQRYYLGRPADAFEIMKKLGLGITNNNFNNLSIKPNKNLSGRILIKIGDSGKAYYINPKDLKPYYLGRPADAFDVMKKMGLGIKNIDLEKITINPSFINKALPPIYEKMEKDIHNLINEERIKNGLPGLKWNDQIASVARQHSLDQANENLDLINNNKICSFPFIHHEGEKFGIYHNQRLNNKGVYYFSASGENIALMPQIKEAQYQAFTDDNSYACRSQLTDLNEKYETTVKTLTNDADKISLLKRELNDRASLADQQANINLTNITYNTNAQVAKDAVIGWMNSPGHRRNILNKDYDEAGIGIAIVKNYFIITQVFIKRAECGYKTGSCCIKPGFYPYCYIPLSCGGNSTCQ